MYPLHQSRYNLKPKVAPVGTVYGRLTVIREAPSMPRSPRGWRRFMECECECGATKVICYSSLKRGLSRSCGCLHKEDVSDRFSSHRMSGSRTYHIWASMMARGKGQTARDRYLDRGITVCERWHTFENFLEDMGECPDGLSLDRKNNDYIYTPENCRYATNSEQARNKSNNIIFHYEGKEVLAIELAEQHGMSRTTLIQRVRDRGWSVEKALTTPVKPCPEKELFTYEGKTCSLNALAKAHGLSATTVRSRIKRNAWTLEKALTTPIK